MQARLPWPAKIAVESWYPFVKVILPGSMNGMSEIQKVDVMHRVFHD